MQKVAACFGLAVRVIQAVVVEMSQDRSRASTNEHATMVTSRQHIKLLFKDGQNSVYCPWKRVDIGAGVREPVSNGQICILARKCKWC
jgi:hypothetical protein